MSRHLGFGVVRIGQVCLSPAVYTETTAIGALLAFSHLSSASARAVTIGLGWDEDHPFRPWPWYSARPLVKNEGTYYCFSLLGLFFGFTSTTKGRASRERV